MEDALYDWLQECLNEGSLTQEELEKIENDDRLANNLWKDFIGGWWESEIDEVIRDAAKRLLRVQKIRMSKEMEQK